MKQRACRVTYRLSSIYDRRDISANHNPHLIIDREFPGLFRELEHFGVQKKREKKAKGKKKKKEFVCCW
jgi:hypothetical protein